MSCKNPIIIGGTGSSGSTLLVSILNRNKEIAAGPELSLFNKEYFFTNSFENFQKNSKRIINKGICTDGWFLYPKFFFEKYGFSSEKINELLMTSSSQVEFIDSFFNSFLESEKKTLWAEKTPSNVYCFKDFLELYPQARLIHIYRDGRDVITSFIKRGMTPYFGTMLWMYNTSIALSYRDHPNYYEIKYEDLVNDPESEIQKLCRFLKVDYHEEMILPDESDNSALESWNHSPTSSINSSSVGKYKLFLTKFQYYTFWQCRISRKHIRKHGLKLKDAKGIQSELGYQDKTESISSPDVFRRIYYFAGLLLLQMKDMLHRYYMLFKYRKKPPPYPGKIAF